MKSKYLFISCLIFFVLVGTFFLSNGIYAQSPEYTVTWFTDSEGLPQNSIKDIVPDKYGYIWLSTENGVVRYDGQDFKLYNQNNHKDFSDNRMLFFDGSIKKDSITVHNIQGEEFLIHQHSVEKGKGDPLKDFIKVEDQKSYGNTIRHSDRNTEIKYNDIVRFLIGNDSIREYDQNHDLKSTTYFPIQIGDQFFMLGDNLYVVKNKKAIFRIEGKSLKETSLNISLDEGIAVYVNDNVNQVFLATGNKIYLLREESGSMIGQRILDNLDLTSFGVHSMYYDMENKFFFIGTSALGLCMVKEKSFRTILTDPENQNRVEYSFIAINDSTLVTPSGTHITNGRYTDKIKFRDNISPYIQVMDEDGHIWLKEKDKNTLYRYRKESNYSTYDMWEFEEGVTGVNLIDNILWVSTYNGIKKKGMIYRMDLAHINPLPERIAHHNIYITCIEEENEGVLLIGSYSGVFKLVLADRVPALKKVESIRASEVRSMYKMDNDIWITTYGQGIFLYRNGNVSSFPLDRNGYLATSHCILEDNNGYFWVSTNKGLFQVAKNVLYDYADNKIDGIYYQYYDKSAGFYTNEFNGGCAPCAVKQPDGQFYFPSLRGIVSFDPNSVRPKLPKYGIFLDEIALDDKVVRPEEDISIHRKTERITFYFSSPHYGNPYNNQVMVKLEGSNHHDWTYLNKENNISYTSLSPGNYTLTARRMAGFDSSYSYKTFGFRIEPAFWQTIWFKMGVVLFVMYLIYFGIQVKLRYARHKNILLERKISERTSQLKSMVGTLRKTKNDLNEQVHNHKKILASLTHDIKTPLKYLSLTGRHIYENLDEGRERIGINAKSIYTSSFQLIQYIDTLLEYTKTNVSLKEANVQSFNIFELVNEKIPVFENIVILRKITVINEIERDLCMDLNKQLFSIVVHNLLDNAIKNTYNGAITFRHEQQGTTRVIIIEDTGFGMPPDKLKYYQDVVSNYDAEKVNGDMDRDKGLGIGIIAELVIIMDAKVKIESSLGKGTRIKLYFPI